MIGNVNAIVVAQGPGRKQEEPVILQLAKTKCYYKRRCKGRNLLVNQIMLTTRIGSWQENYICHGIFFVDTMTFLLQITWQLVNMCQILHVFCHYVNCFCTFSHGNFTYFLHYSKTNHFMHIVNCVKKCGPWQIYFMVHGKFIFSKYHGFQPNRSNTTFALIICHTFAMIRIVSPIHVPFIHTCHDLQR